MGVLARAVAAAHACSRVVPAVHVRRRAPQPMAPEEREKSRSIKFAANQPTSCSVRLRDDLSDFCLPVVRVVRKQGKFILLTTSPSLREIAQREVGEGEKKKGEGVNLARKDEKRLCQL